MHLPFGGVYVDEFTKSSGRFYFLSHFHSDHYAGLTPTWNYGTVFCSETTAALVFNKFPSFCKQRVHVLPLDTPVMLALGYGEYLTVTLIDANHCPGAVMILFESGRFGRYLHTGDFRFDPVMLQHPSLKDGNIDHLFLDSTFVEPYFEFPTRITAAEEMAKIIEKHPGHRIVIGMDWIGKEELIVELARAFDCKIHVTATRLARLKLLLPSVECFTTDFEAAFITLCSRNTLTRRKVERWNESKPTIAIVPSGWASLARSSTLKKTDATVFPAWMTEDMKDLVRYNDSECAKRFMFTVPYSCHSSFSELSYFVQHIRPRNLTSNLPRHSTSMIRYFEKFLNPEKAPTFEIPRDFLDVRIKGMETVKYTGTALTRKPSECTPAKKDQYVLFKKKNKRGAKIIQCTEENEEEGEQQLQQQQPIEEQATNLKRKNTEDTDNEEAKSDVVVVITAAPAKRRVQSNSAIAAAANTDLVPFVSPHTGRLLLRSASDITAEDMRDFDIMVTTTTNEITTTTTMPRSPRLHFAENSLASVIIEEEDTDNDNKNDDAGSMRLTMDDDEDEDGGEDKTVEKSPRLHCSQSSYRMESP